MSVTDDPLYRIFFLVTSESSSSRELGVVASIVYEWPRAAEEWKTKEMEDKIEG